MINVITLCSGVDSQCMALDALKDIHSDFGYNLVAWSEIDKDAIKAHNMIFPQFEGRNVGDMSKVDWSQFNEKIDLLTYSTPCTDISKIGHLKGFDVDDKTRSSVLWSTINVIKELHPTYLMMENVSNIISPKYYNQFLEWCKMVESEGYDNYFDVIDSLDYGVPQRRKRLFMISVKKSENKVFNFFNGTKECKPLIDYVDDINTIPSDVIDSVEEFNERMNDDMCPEYKILLEHIKNKKIKETHKIISWSRDKKGIVLRYNLRDVCNTLTVFGAGNNWNTTPHILSVFNNDGNLETIMRRLTVYEMCRFMDFPKNVCKMLAESFPRMVVSKLAGNSIVVGVMTDIFERLFYDKRNDIEMNTLF